MPSIAVAGQVLKQGGVSVTGFGIAVIWLALDICIDKDDFFYAMRKMKLFPQNGY